MIIDENYLGKFINLFDDFVEGMKEGYGNSMKEEIAKVFNTQGLPTQNTNPLETRGINPQWEKLSPITVQLKSSSAILMDTRQMINFVKWQIEDSRFDSFPDILKFGWFEDSGDRAYIAAIHEYGLTGQTFVSDDYHIMGGAPIGRTKEARAKVRWWFKNNLKMNVSGRVIIPERSMLRKTADLIVPQMEELAWVSFLEFFKEIKSDPNNIQQI